MYSKKIMILPGALFLLGFMPYAGTVEEDANLPFSEPIVELQDIEKLADEEFYRNNFEVLPDTDPRSEVPESIIEELNQPNINQEL